MIQPPTSSETGWTYQYRQPEDYRFCQDSVIFPAFIASQLKSENLNISPDFQALDVCAGCGVIGMELAFHLPELKNFDFLEIQRDFEPFFSENLAITGHEQDSYRLLLMNYRELLSPDFAERYDLIVGNPPYFRKEEGRLSPNPLNNRCRFFLDSDLKTLVLACAHSLKKGGSAFLLVKSGENHGRKTLRELALALAGSASIEIVGQVRSTDVLRIRK